MLGILLSALAAMVLGFLWYGPLFGKSWMKLSGISREKIDSAKKKGMTLTYGITMLGAIVMAFVLNKVINVLGIRNIYPSLELAFWLWLGLIATTMLASVTYEGKPWKLYLINTGYQLVSLLAMAVILVLV